METIRAVLQAAGQVREAEEAAAVVAQEAADPAVVGVAEVEVAAEAAEEEVEVAAVGVEGEVETSHLLERVSIVALNASSQFMRPAKTSNALRLKTQAGWARKQCDDGGPEWKKKGASF
jgi:hypothetical protein